MGFFKNMFAQFEDEINSAVQGAIAGATGQSVAPQGSGKKKKSGAPATRWEKAVVGLDKIVSQVVKVDPDGVDIVCFGGESDAQWYRNVREAKGLEEMVNDRAPRGRCYMGDTIDECIKDAFDKDMTKRPVAILVLTAGKPDDTEELDAALKKTVNRLAEEYSTCPLSITFVQIGNDEDASEYLSHLDNHIQAKSSQSGETFDLVDTIKDEEIQAAMKEIKGTGSDGKKGALVGAIAGAALGVGGMYIYNKQQAKKRTEGWNGKWKLSYGGDEIADLTVQDDLKGNLTIEGFPDQEEATTGTYTVDKDDSSASSDSSDDEEYEIHFIDPAENEEIEGTVEDEHAITWSDGTRWDEIPPDEAGWAQYAGAGLAGAAAAGATGYLLDKKFFNKVSKKDHCDYVIVMDRSSKMRVVDENDAHA